MADNVISMLPGGMPSGALDALKNNQRQLDFDGCEVGVSRQALDEIIAAYEALSARVAGEAMPVAVRQLEWETVSKTFIRASVPSLKLFYGIVFMGGSWVSQWGGSGHRAEDLSVIMDAAQADFEARISSALHPASVTGAEGGRTMAEVSLSIASEVRRRNRIGEEGERHSIAPACEGAAADLVLAALTSCGFAVVPAALDRKGGKDA